MGERETLIESSAGHQNKFQKPARSHDANPGNGERRCSRCLFNQA
jgi:hypothetical protein